MTERPAARDEASDIAALVAAAKRGDRDALDYLCAQFYDDILHYFTERIPAHAEDLTQKLFASLDRKLDGYRESGRFHAWLRSVAYHMFLTQLRSDRRRKEDTLKTGADIEESSTTTMFRTKKGELRHLAQQLPPSLRDAWDLHVQHYSHDEIAARLGITPGAAMTRVSRARSLLAQWLMPADEPDEPDDTDQTDGPDPHKP